MVLEKGLVSVVIPVYNVEKYLDRCITSVVNQTYQKLEIILVDDGSPDNCPRLCEEWKKKDSRIRVIHKRNEGLGMARNTGIMHATGEYICFFDSDDFVEFDTIETAYTTAILHDADLVCFGMSSLDANGTVKKKKVPIASKQVYRKEEVISEFLVDLVGPDPKTGLDKNISMSSCCKLFSIQSIQKNNWRFVSEREIIAEDFYSLLSLYPDIDTVCIIPKALYNYCENSTSLTHTYRPDRYNQAKNFYEQTKMLCHKLGYCDEVAHRFRKPFLSFVISALKQEMQSEKDLLEKRNAVRKILDDKLLEQTLLEGKDDKVGFKQRLLFWTMRYKLYSLCCVLLVAQNRIKN